MTYEDSAPVLQAFVLAERIYTDASTNQRIICGTFNQIIVPSNKFPCLSGNSAYAFVLLGEVTTKIEVQLRFVDLKDNKVIMHSPEVPVRAKDPLMPIDLVFEIPPLFLPQAGIYSFECWASSHMVGSVRVPVTIAGND